MIPKPIVAQHNGSDREIDMRFKSIGNEQAQALGKYISVSSVEKVNLVGNRLLTTGAKAIIKGINKTLKELNLSDNLLNPRKLKKAKEHYTNRQMPSDLTGFESRYLNNKAGFQTPFNRQENQAKSAFNKQKIKE